MKRIPVEMPFISIVIVTLNRKAHLRKCLTSLFDLDYPLRRFEVIVVDGNSKDGTKEMIESDFPEVRYVLEKRKGIPLARNSGWKHARGDFIAYTDDDCVVDRFWLRYLLNGFTTTRIGAVGGKVLYLHPELYSDVFYQTPVGIFSLGEKERFLKPYENLITANMVVRSEAFKKTEFLESLVYSDSEDYEFCWSLMELGYTLKYVPTARVLHDIDPKRVKLSHLLKRIFYSGISHYIVARKRDSREKLIPRFLRAFVGGILDFLSGKRFANRIAAFFWFSLCLVSFLSSIVLLYKDF